MKLFAKLKNDKKGFTLVEMIVVIVIIGILLAILVPGMFKYIDKAKDKQIQVNARTALMNMEDAVLEVYGMNGVTGVMINQWFTGATGSNPANATFKFPLKNDATNGGIGKITFTFTDPAISVEHVMLPLPNNSATIEELAVDSNGIVTKMIYQEGLKQVTYTEAGWSDVVTLPKKS